MSGRPQAGAAAAYLEARPPEPRTPWREVPFCVLDFETAGLDPAADEIISFGAVMVEGGRVTMEGAVHRLIRPRRMPSAETIRIHGLRPVDLESAPSLEEALDPLLAAITGRAIVAHAAVIERSFLRAALADSGIEVRNPFVDTAAMAAEFGRRSGRVGAGRSALKLSDLARALHLPVHRPHHADGDALTTAQVFLALATHLEGDAPLTLEELQGLDAPLRRKPGPLARLLRRIRSG